MANQVIRWGSVGGAIGVAIGEALRSGHPLGLARFQWPLITSTFVPALVASMGAMGASVLVNVSAREAATGRASVSTLTQATAGSVIGACVAYLFARLVPDNFGGFALGAFAAWLGVMVGISSWRVAGRSSTHTVIIVELLVPACMGAMFAGVTWLLTASSAAGQLVFFSALLGKFDDIREVQEGDCIPLCLQRWLGEH